MKSSLAASLLLMVCSVGCDGEQSTSPDGMSAECLVPMTDPPSRFDQLCWRDLGNGTCDDLGKTAACSGTTLTCPPGYVLGDRCVCSRGGEAPGCTCSAVTGRICQDAGARDGSLDGHGDTAGMRTDTNVSGLPDAAPADAAAAVDAPPAD